jgi:hypothetical protein
MLSTFDIWGKSTLITKKPEVLQNNIVLFPQKIKTHYACLSFLFLKVILCT